MFSLQQIGNLNEEELASPPEPSKEPETPKAIQNGGVTESITEGTGTEKVNYTLI